MSLSDERNGILFMYAGLSARTQFSPVRPQALKAWLNEENTEGLIDRETLYLFRSGYITTLDGEAYTVTGDGWASLDDHLRAEEEAAQREERETGESLPRKPLLPAKHELPDALVLMGEWQVKAGAQRLTTQVLSKIRDHWRNGRIGR